MIIVRRCAHLVLALLAAAVAVYAYRYLLPGMPGGGGAVIANRYSPGALLVHAGFAATALLLGALQFVRTIRSRWPRWHRRIGTVYVIACLIGGSAGFVLALGTTSGRVASLGFGSLALAWIGCTAQAWRFARARDFARHQRWMVRSYALTLAAVTLRLYLPLAASLSLDMRIAYPAISFLCWVPNLLTAELLLVAGFFHAFAPQASALHRTAA